MDSPSTIITKSAGETAEFGKNFAASLTSEAGKPRSVLCLYGQLGSGKTTFTQGFVRGLGITDRLLSPTFLIVRRYKIPEISGFLYHLDLYRVSREDLGGIGIDEILHDTSSFVLIEWAEKMGELLPKERVDIHFEVLEDDVHKIRVKQISN